MVMLSTGIYTAGEAAALLHTRAATIRRWAFGYSRTRATGKSTHRAILLKNEWPVIEGERALSFVELVELLYVREFVRLGIGWHEIKEGARILARIFGSEHPFALRQLYFDPKRLYARLREHDGGDGIVQLTGHGQNEIPQLVRPYLDQLEFDAGDVASRWWPTGKDGGVVIDPSYSFGAPIVDEVGIRADVLAAAYHAERTRFGDHALERVAWTYEIEPTHVRMAVGFATWLSAN